MTEGNFFQRKRTARVCKCGTVILLHLSSCHQTSLQPFRFVSHNISSNCEMMSNTLESCFSASPKYALTFLIVDDSISASRCVRFIATLANLGDLRGVDVIFNEGVDTRGF